VRVGARVGDGLAGIDRLVLIGRSPPFDDRATSRVARALPLLTVAATKERCSGSFGGEGSSWEGDRDPWAAEVDEGDEGCGGVEGEASV
jgi:hypothetical protein